MSKLPPLNNLPSWSRSSLERRKVHRSIPKDPIAPLSKSQEVVSFTNRSGSEAALLNRTALNPASKTKVRIVSAPTSPHQGKVASRREAHLQKSISFLQEQHQETLSKLQDEVERLKYENKELNFKLIVTREASAPSSTPSSATSAESRQRASGSYYRSKIRRLENEMKNMKLSLIEAQKQNVDLSKRLSERELSGKRYKTLPPVSNCSKLQSPRRITNEQSEIFTSKSADNLSSRESLRDQNINHINLFSPGKTTMLKVRFGKKGGDVCIEPSSGAGLRSPTMAECKDIIHYLEDTNKKQGQELTRLKEEIKEGGLSSNTYLVTKTLNGGYDRNVILPALRPAGSGNVAGRRRGQQAVLRGRGKRDVNY